MDKPVNAYVLLDTEALVYGVVTDYEIAEKWLTLDPSFGFYECELDDYTAFNAVCDELDDE